MFANRRPVLSVAALLALAAALLASPAFAQQSEEALALPTLQAPPSAGTMTLASDIGGTGWLRTAVAKEAARAARSDASFRHSPSRVRQEPGQRKRSWIGRHPVLFGTLVGFGSGFLMGYLPGDDGVFDDYTAEFGGLVLGGAGAGAGALVGALVAVTRN